MIGREGPVNHFALEQWAKRQPYEKGLTLLEAHVLLLARDVRRRERRVLTVDRQARPRVVEKTELDARGTASSSTTSSMTARCGSPTCRPPRRRSEQYLLDSAHHGLAMNPVGTKLCAAGTMSDYAAIVSRRSSRYKLVPVGEKPYWATNSGDGKRCFVSVSGDDAVSVISYRTGEEVACIPVGDHPQRMRMGRVRRAFVR